MQNSFEQDLQPGDDIVYVEPGSWKGLKVGKIVRLTPQKVVIGFPNPKEPGKFIEVDKIDPWLAYKIPPPPPSVTVGNLDELDEM